MFEGWRDSGEVLVAPGIALGWSGGLEPPLVVEAEWLEPSDPVAPSFVRVLTHPVTGVRLTMDRTTCRPPADLRRWLRIRDQECRDPGCRRPAGHADIDHVTEWQHDGTTDAVNLVSICRSMHLLKSMGLWRQTVNPDESVTWTSPWGRTMTVPPLERAAPAPAWLLVPDHEGRPPVLTRRVTRWRGRHPPARPRAGRPSSSASPRRARCSTR